MHGFRSTLATIFMHQRSTGQQIIQTSSDHSFLFSEKDGKFAAEETPCFLTLHGAAVNQKGS